MKTLTVRTCVNRNIRRLKEREKNYPDNVRSFIVGRLIMVQSTISK